MTDAKKPRIPNGLKFLFAANAGVAAVMTIQPFDLVKSRMQTAAIHGKLQHRSSWHLIQSIVANEGVLGLYQGLGAAMLRQFIYTGTRLPLYIYMNETYKEVKKSDPPVIANMLMGIVAGAVGAFVATPTDVALIRMTTDGQMAPADRRNYTSVWNALHRIGHEEGVLNMWRGCMPTVIRAMVISMSQLASYSYFRRLFMTSFNLMEGLTLHTCASMASGLITTIASLPVDILKTRIQNMTIIDGKPQFSGTFDVLSQLLKNEGVLSLWKGFTPYFFRVAPQTVFLFLFLEQQNRLYMKYVLGVESKGSGL